MTTKPAKDYLNPIILGTARAANVAARAALDGHKFSGLNIKF